MGVVLPGAIVILTLEGVMYGLWRAFGIPAVRELGFLPLRGVCRNLDGVNMPASGVRVERVGAEDLRC